MGRENRIYAAYKFVLYTLFGSVLMLLAFLAMVTQAGTSDIPVLMDTDFSPEMQKWLWIGLFASFAIKIPMWPVHTWLPAAHVEAPTAGSVMLAGVLMKMGGYGFLRFMIPMVPDATLYFTPLIFSLIVRRDCLHGSGRVSSARYEKNDCLFLGSPYGDCDPQGL